MQITEKTLELLDEMTASGRMRTIIENIPGGVFWCKNDEALTLEYVSSGFLTMIGYTMEQLRREKGGSLRGLILPEDMERTLGEVTEQLRKGDKKTIEYRLKRRDGGVLWVLDSGQFIADGGPGSYCCILVDITETVAAREELTLSIERQRIVMEHTNDVIFEWMPGTGKFTMSSNWEKNFGPVPGNASQLTADFILRQMRVHPDDVEKVLDALTSVSIDSARMPDLDLRMLSAQEGYRWCRLRVSIQRAPKGEALRYIGLIRDIDRDKRISEKLQQEAERDALTGLYNRRAAQKLIVETLCRDTVRPHALMIIDLDNFKTINDTKGHLYGDAVLSGFASTMLKIFRPGDIVSRYAGDEFTVFLKGVSSGEEAEARAEKLLEAVRHLTNDAKSGLPPLTCSIGIAVAPDDARDYTALFQSADSALYRAKELGKDQVVRYRSADSAGEDPLRKGTVFTAIDQADYSLNEADLSFINSVFNLLYESKSIAAAIPLVLEIIGRRYDVSRTYIFEVSEDRETFSNTFEWCREGVIPEIDHLQQMPCHGEDRYFENFSETGVFYCPDVSTLPAAQQKVLNPQGVQALLQCVIEEGGSIAGFVGLDECTAKRYWRQNQVSTLRQCARMLCVFLKKLRLEERFAKNAPGGSEKVC